MSKVATIQRLVNCILKERQIIRFAIIGVSNLVISLITYYCVIYLGLHYQIANVLGFITGSLNGYLWNKKWVFKESSKGWGSLMKFYITYLSTWLLGAVLLWIEVEILGMSELFVPFINIFITTPVNYILNKYWTFKRR